MRPYPWEKLPKITRRDAGLLSAAAAHLQLGWMRSLGPVLPGLTVGPLVLAPAQPLPAAATLTLRWGVGRSAQVMIEGRLAGRIAAAALGTPDQELPAPRAPTRVERALLAWACAAALDAAGALDVTVIDGEAPQAREDGIAFEAIVGLGGASGLVRVIVPEALVLRSPRIGDPGRLLSALAAALVQLRVVGAWTRMSAVDVAHLAPRDVLVPTTVSVGRDGCGAVRLAVGRGAFPARLDGSAVEIVGPYQEGDPMNEHLSRDLPVEILCELARVTLSAREVLELQPGAVLPLARPAGTQVELTAGGRAVARGELVDLDGELAVRILEIA